MRSASATGRSRSRRSPRSASTPVTSFCFWSSRPQGRAPRPSWPLPPATSRPPSRSACASSRRPGFVVRRPSPADGRATIVELSDEGRALLPKLKAAWRHLAEQTVAGLTVPVDQVASVLGDLAASLGAADAGSGASHATRSTPSGAERKPGSDNAPALSRELSANPSYRLYQRRPGPAGASHLIDMAEDGWR